MGLRCTRTMRSLRNTSQKLSTCRKLLRTLTPLGKGLYIPCLHSLPQLVRCWRACSQCGDAQHKLGVRCWLWEVTFVWNQKWAKGCDYILLAWLVGAQCTWGAPSCWRGGCGQSVSLLLLPSIFPSITVFSNESVLRIRWLEYWSFSFSISPSSEYSRLISFRVDGLILLAVQGTLRSLLQHHSSEASILWHSAFFIVQLSHPYMTTRKTIALTKGTFAGKGSISAF